MGSAKSIFLETARETAANVSESTAPVSSVESTVTRTTGVPLTVAMTTDSSTNPPLVTTGSSKAASSADSLGAATMYSLGAGPCGRGWAGGVSATIVPAPPWDDQGVIGPADRSRDHLARPVNARRAPQCAGTSLSSLTRAATAGAAAALVVMGLGGCGVHFATAPGGLPQLSGVEALRDQAVRTDAAAQVRAEELVLKATSCPPCQSVLASVATDSQVRVEALGGLWDPWEGATPEGAQAPEIVADAPMEPAAFVSWLAASAERDLKAVAADESIPGEDARMIASVAAGRLASAHLLGQAYGMDVYGARDQVAQLATRLNELLEENEQKSGGWSLDPALVGEPEPVALPVDSALFQASAEAASAVKTWDCVAQTLPQSQVEGLVEDSTTRADLLLVRAASFLEAGVADTRQQRCQLDVADVTTLESWLISADLDLFVSGQTEVRTVGIDVVREDIRRSLSWGSESVGVPAPLPGTASH